MKMGTYPNLELLEYKVLMTLKNYDKFCNPIQKKKGFIEFEAIVFPQWWGSTCTGFDVTKDGTPSVGGSAMTKEYTVVFHELTTDIYVVCFGNCPCYIVDNANSQFFEDLNMRRMKSLSEAKEFYS